MTTIMMRIRYRLPAGQAQVASTRADLESLSEANHRNAAELDSLRTNVAELRNQVSELEATVAAQSEQLRRAITDVLERMAERG